MNLNPSSFAESIARSAMGEIEAVVAKIYQFNFGCASCGKTPMTTTVHYEGEEYVHYCGDCLGDVCEACCMDNYVQSK